MEDRKRKIEEGLLLTDKMKSRETELNQEREKVLDKAKAEVAKAWWEREIKEV